MAYVFSLKQEQAERLLAYLRDYRQFLLGQQLLSMERNQIQRLLQTVQGKLIIGMDEPKRMGQLQLLLVHEEIQALKTMATELLVNVANGTRKTEDRSATMGDLAALKATLERLYQMPPSFAGNTNR